MMSIVMSPKLERGARRVGGTTRAPAIRVCTSLCHNLATPKRERNHPLTLAVGPINPEEKKISPHREAIASASMVSFITTYKIIP